MDADPNNNDDVTDVNKSEPTSLEQTLQAALSRLDVALIKDLILRGAQLQHLRLDSRKYRNAVHELALVYCAQQPSPVSQSHLKFIEIFTLLTQNGLGVNDVDIDRQTALHLLASTSGQADAMRVLLASGVNVNAQDR